MEASSGALELWGGVECTVNRVRQGYHEQLTRSGHSKRLSDLDRFAALGIKALRQPVLWELVAPHELSSVDWEWPDVWLAKLQQLGIRPIVGLLHHGSGPEHTSLVDPEFPEKLAAYADAVAARYPWVLDYTPINEPLTTARFSALYGHWFPHAADNNSFVRALLNQCRATVLAMDAIRRHQPGARLVQTDDLGKTYSTPELAYQADFENHRRWLAWDLLCGYVTSRHPLHRYLMENGASREELQWFRDHLCRPDIIGINHYVTSDRFLDTHLHRYPAETHGGNGRVQYADVAAARVREDGPIAPDELIVEAWHRYRVPIALTEVHQGCSREEQLRWLLEMWDGADSARARGADVRAITLWSLLGAFDWDSLVTRQSNSYEPGAFDIRGPQPRATAIAKLATELVDKHASEHPLLEVPGWWRRPQRLLHGVALNDAGMHAIPSRAEEQRFEQVAPVLITGGRGTLARAFARACVIRGIPHRVLVRSELDIADPESVHNVVEQLRPWAIINTAGYVRVDEAERDPDACFRENAVGPKILAEQCERRGIKLITFSSDLVFDGRKASHYVELDSPAPLNVYGESKLRAESEVMNILPTALVVRTSAFFGPWDQYNFIFLALRALANKQTFRAAADATVSPTYVPDLVNSSLDLMIDDEHGLWHVANHGAISWADLATRAAEAAGLDPALIEACETRDLGLPARRPLYSALASSRIQAMPSLDDALARYLRDSGNIWTPAQQQELLSA